MQTSASSESPSCYFRSNKEPVRNKQEPAGYYSYFHLLKPIRCVHVGYNVPTSVANNYYHLLLVKTFDDNLVCIKSRLVNWRKNTSQRCCLDGDWWPHRCISSITLYYNNPTARKYDKKEIASNKQKGSLRYFQTISRHSQFHSREYLKTYFARFKDEFLKYFCYTKFSTIPSVRH